MVAPAIVPFSLLLARDRLHRVQDSTGLRNPILLLCWSTVPPTALFAIAVLTPARLLFARYFLSAAPGLALLTGCTVSAIASRRGRIALVAAMAALWITTFAEQRTDDWRSAATAVRSLTESPNTPDTPVLLRSGFIESRQQRLLETAETAEYLVAPFAFYPVPGTLVPLPWSAGDTTDAYLEDLVRRLNHHRRLVLVTNGFPRPLRDWFDNRMGHLSLTAHPVATFGRVSVVLFD